MGHKIKVDRTGKKHGFYYEINSIGELELIEYVNQYEYEANMLAIEDLYWSTGHFEDDDVLW